MSASPAGPRDIPFLQRYRKSVVTLFLFVAYAVIVFWGNYLALERSRANGLTQFRLEAEKQASAISYFFSERRNDLNELAQSAAVSSFFVNSDLGMSFEYGLGVNVQVIEDSLARLASRKRIGDMPIYSSLVLTDGEGAVVAAWNRKVDDAHLADLLRSTGRAAQVAMCDREHEVLVSAPVVLEGVLRGRLFGWVRTDASFAQFGDASSHPGTLLVDRSTGRALRGMELPSGWHQRVWESLNRPPHAVSAAFEDRNGDVAFARVDIVQTPLSFVSVVSGLAHYEHSLWLMVIAGGVVPLVVMAITVLDVIERRRLDALREDARLAAERLAQTRSEFIANMSHEIRTPMNAIIGMTELCLGTGLNAKQRNYVAKIQRASESLLRIVNEILDFAKIESGKFEIDHVAFAVDHVLEGIGELLGEKASEKSLELVFDVDDSVTSTFVGDPRRIEQVLINLVGNAIKFSERGNIVVRVRAVAMPADEARLEFAVTDEGIGLSSEAQEHIFQAFRQADMTTTRRYGGTGLGLTISKHLVELMRGAIAVESTPGVGSNFRFSVIVGVAAAVGDKILAMKRALAPYAHRPVLVVDDNLVTQAAIAAQLTQLGLRVDDCLSCDEAVATVSRPGARDYLAALVDVDMPGEGGKATLQRLRSAWSGRNAPPIILMGNGSRDRDDGSTGALFESLIAKPTTATRLFGEITSFLGWQSEKTARLPAASPVATDLSGIDVLVVDDVMLNQEVIRDVLESVGMRVRIVSNGAEALVSIRQHLPDCVIMDCQMPVMDGYEATRQLRRDERFAKLPIIALTANAMPAERERCRAAGMDDYVAKPVRAADLLAVVARHVQTGARLAAAKGVAGTPAFAELPGIDVRLGLHYANDKPGLYRKLLAVFVESYGATFANDFAAARTREDRRGVVRLAHSLKGAALVIGACGLSELARGFEENCRADAWEVIDACVGSVMSELAVVCDGIGASVKASPADAAAEQV